MLPFFPSEPMDKDAVVSASKTMLKVAHADGVHAAEIDLIRSFYTSGLDGRDWPSFDKLLQEASGDLHVTAQAFSDERQRETVIALCVMTGLADGTLSDAEQAAVRSIANDLNIAPNRLTEIIDLVKDNMLAQLSHLPDAGSVAKVAKELS